MKALLEKSSLEYEAIDFNQIKASDYLPALSKGIELASKRIELIKKEEEINFDSIILKYETSSDELDQVVEVFYSLYSAHCTEEISAIAEEFNQKLTEYSSDVSLDSKLFEKIKAVYDIQDKLNLDKEQKRLLSKIYKGFTRNGSLLNDTDKKKLRELDQKLSKLSLGFSENVRKASNLYVLEINNEKDVKGMPEGVLEAAMEMAKSKKVKSKYAFTLDYPSVIPFLTYCQNRELRLEMRKAFTTRATEGEFKNQDNIIDTLKAKKERAILLGYKDHAEYVLEERMAKNPTKVMSFLEEILHKAMPKAKEDYAKLKNLKKELTNSDEFEYCDQSMYSEILKKRELDFDDEVLRPYFKLENVIQGVFDIAKKLYGLSFEEKSTIPKYHEDVKTYVVKEESGDYLGLFYADFFPRTEKRSGAWMTTFRNVGFQFGEVKRPFVSIVCNFTKPTATKPSLLTLNEVYTLFHEFGHALHGLLAKSKYKAIGGTNVSWDFVELPSQIMENWVTEKECLDMFAKHYETGETIPKELISKIKKSVQFLEGLGTLRQLSFGFLDMHWHTIDPYTISDVIAEEKEVLKPFGVFPSESFGAMSTSFGHIFAGGYSAGYYSYKWAEVLDADAFSYFEEKGIFNKEIATNFKKFILEKGDSEDPMDLYIKFRGHEPNADALMKRAGLV